MVFKGKQLADFPQPVSLFTVGSLLLVQQNTWDSTHITISGALMLSLKSVNHIYSADALKEKKKTPWNLKESLLANLCRLLSAWLVSSILWAGPFSVNHTETSWEESYRF